MKTKVLTALILVLGIALSGSAFAQGRHDEKPHGMTKPAAEAKDNDRAVPRAGRHDERPHGMKAPAKKADAAKDSK